MYEELVTRLRLAKAVLSRNKDLIALLSDAADAIEELSKERKTGKWVKISPAGIRECSLCHHSILTSDIDVYKFCFSCGAQMIGGDEDEDV